MNALIAFYSRAGENYIGGVIKELPVGNTEVIAQIVNELTGAALYKIEPAIAYSRDYSDCLDETLRDQHRMARPALKMLPPDLAPYDVIYLGFPNYWGMTSHKANALPDV